MLFLTLTFMFLLSLSCCSSKTAHTDNGKSVTDSVLPDQETVQTAPVISVDSMNTACSETSKVSKVKENQEGLKKNMDISDVDTTRIYEQSEVGSSAFCSVADAQVPAFLNKYFKYPDIEPTNGRGICDLVVERDGTISDVIIVKGIHPELDKEFIRVFKLMPKFLPAKIGNTAVRSKYRMPIVAMAK